MATKPTNEQKDCIRSNEYDDYQIKDYAFELTDEERKKKCQEAHQVLDDVVCSVLKK